MVEESGESDIKRIFKLIAGTLDKSSKRAQTEALGAMEAEPKSEAIGLPTSLKENPREQIAELRKKWNIPREDVEKAAVRPMFQSPEEIHRTLIRFLGVKPLIAVANEAGVSMRHLARMIVLGKVEHPNPNEAIVQINDYIGLSKLIEQAAERNVSVNGLREIVKGASPEEFKERYGVEQSEALARVNSIDLLLGEGEVRMYMDMIGKYKSQANGVFLDVTRKLSRAERLGDERGIRDILKESFKTHHEIWEEGPPELLHFAEAHRRVLEHGKQVYGLEVKKAKTGKVRCYKKRHRGPK